MADAEAPKIEVGVVREHRTDRAERTLTLTGPADLSYTHIGRSWTRKAGLSSERRWRAVHIRITWDMGELDSVNVWGHRYKVDGEVGQIKESATWRIKVIDGEIRLIEPYSSQEAPEPPAWLIALVGKHCSPVPALKSFRVVGA